MLRRCATLLLVIWTGCSLSLDLDERDRFAAGPPDVDAEPAGTRPDGTGTEGPADAAPPPADRGPPVADAGPEDAAGAADAAPPADAAAGDAGAGPVDAGPTPEPACVEGAPAPLPRADRPCPAAGVCAGAAGRCVDGAVRCALPSTWRAEEGGADCDRLDNDCDGRADEACATPGARTWRMHLLGVDLRLGPLPVPALALEAQGAEVFLRAPSGRLQWPSGRMERAAGGQVTLELPTPLPLIVARLRGMLTADGRFGVLHAVGPEGAPTGGIMLLVEPEPAVEAAQGWPFTRYDGRQNRRPLLEVARASFGDGLLVLRDRQVPGGLEPDPVRYRLQAAGSGVRVEGGDGEFTGGFTRGGRLLVAQEEGAAHPGTRHVMVAGEPHPAAAADLAGPWAVLGVGSLGEGQAAGPLDLEMVVDPSGRWTLGGASGRIEPAGERLVWRDEGGAPTGLEGALLAPADLLLLWRQTDGPSVPALLIAIRRG